MESGKQQRDTILREVMAGNFHNLIDRPYFADYHARRSNCGEWVSGLSHPSGLSDEWWGQVLKFLYTIRPVRLIERRKDFISGVINLEKVGLSAMEKTR